MVYDGNKNVDGNPNVCVLATLYAYITVGAAAAAAAAAGGIRPSACPSVAGRDQYSDATASMAHRLQVSVATEGSVCVVRAGMRARDHLRLPIGNARFCEHVIFGL